MKVNLIAGALALLLSIGAAEPASGQDISVILQMLDHLEKRLDKLEALRNKDMVNMQQQLGQATVAKGAGSVTVSGDSLYSTLSSQIGKLATELAEVKKNGAQPDSAFGQMISRLDKIEAQASQAREGRPATGDKQPADLLDELRGLASKLRETIQNGTKPDTKKESEVFKPEVTGYLYYYHDASSGNGKTNSFDISRTYIGGKYRLSDRFTFRYLSDIGHETGGGKFEVFTKYAYMDWKLSSTANLFFGQQGTLNFKVPEKAWGYRVIRMSPMESFGDYWGMVSKAYLERLDQRSQELTASGYVTEANELTVQKKNFVVSSKGKLSSSADQGIAISIKPDQRTYLDFMVRNGSGYKKAEDDKYKNYSVRGGGYFLNKALQLSAFMEVEPWEGTEITGSAKEYTNFQWDLFASYAFKEYFILCGDVNSKRFAGSYEDITSYCYSVFGNVSLVPRKLKILGRYDFYQAGFNEAPSAGPDGLKTNASLVVLGLDYIADKHVHIIPNFQILSHEDPSKDAEVSFYVHMLVEL